MAQGLFLQKPDAKNGVTCGTISGGCRPTMTHPGELSLREGKVAVWHSCLPALSLEERRLLGHLRAAFQYVKGA